MNSYLGPRMSSFRVANLPNSQLLRAIRALNLKILNHDATGAFSGVVLPRGDYEVVVSAAERDDEVIVPITVGAGNTLVAVPSLSARGTALFEVRERTRGQPLIPAKLTFKGVTPTPDPRFGEAGDREARPGNAER